MLVTGASGFIGSHITAALIRRGHQVTGCSRRPAQHHPGLQWVTCDFASDLRPEAWVPRLQGMDAVVNAVGIIQETGSNTFSALHRDAPRALFEACQAAGVRKVMQISALGADAGARSRFHLTKKAADDYLAGLDLDWTILLPSIVYGPRGKSFALFKALAALPLIPLVGDGRQQVQPIYVEDLAQAVVSLLEQLGPMQRRLAAVGPQVITVQELLETLRTWLSLPPTRPLRLPVPLLRAGAKTIDRLGRGQATETLDMLLRGNTADVQPFVGATGVQPRSLTEVLRVTPSLQQDRWHAHLYFLRPLLRLSIAFIWLATGIISAFVYPAAESYALLARVGIHGWLAPVALYGAAALDFALGLGTLLRYRVRLMGIAQLAVLTGFSIIIALWLPEFWLHPFGPLTKNVPLAAAILVMIALEDESE